MKTVYQYIKFRKSTDGQRWYCHNKKSGITLAYLEYCAAWKQWVFSQEMENVIFSASCLRDIADFLENLNKELTHV